MLIGELSKRSGLTRDAIRFYERQGYIKVSWRERRANNYKEYSEEVLRRLLLFKKIKSYGFTLNETAEIIALIEAKLASCHTIEKVVNEKVGIIDQQIQELRSLKRLLELSIVGCREGSGDNTESKKSCPLFNLE